MELALIYVLVHVHTHTHVPSQLRIYLYNPDVPLLSACLSYKFDCYKTFLRVSR